MSQNQEMDKHIDEEITLKELLFKLKEFGLEIWSKKLWLFISIVLFAGLMLLSAYLKPILYKGEITFMLNEDAGSRGGVSSLLGQFGFGVGQSGGNVYRILELSKSRIITQRVLFEKVNVGSKNDYLANHIIKEYDFHENWKESKGGLKEFLFTRDSIAAFDIAENTALKQLHRFLIGSSSKKGLFFSSIDEQSGILNISTETTSSDISFHLVGKIYSHLTDYYRNKTIEKQQKTYTLFKARTDSIEQALNTAQYRLSRFQDSSRGLMLRQDEVQQQRLELEVDRLVVAYGEAYKNLELANFSLKNETPFIQMIDAPLRPLDRIKSSKTRAVVIGGLLGFIIATIFFIVRKIIVDTLRD